MSSSDEDEPISRMIAKKSKKNRIEEEDDDDEDESDEVDEDDGDENDEDEDDDDEEEDEDDAEEEADKDSDSDDDLPIAELIKKRKKVVSSKRKVAKEPRVREKRPRLSDVKPSAKGNSKSSIFYSSTEKGKLVQQFLIRWWYAVEWPSPDDIARPPAGYEPLEGFPGVFVSTRTDALGRILDMRNKESCPCLAVYSKKPSSELKSLCITAIEGQMKALREAEGEDSRLLEDLRSTLATIKKIDPARADREGKAYENCFQLYPLKK